MAKIIEMDIAKLAHILTKHKAVRDSEIDMEAFFDFMADFMETEADTIEKAEPYATKTIRALRAAAHYIKLCGYDIGDMMLALSGEEPDIKPYSSVCPWNAPGMSVKDFL